MEEWAVVFPGQGSQSVGMARDVAEISAGARDVFSRANDVLGIDITRLCFEGPAEELGRTDIQQPAIFVASVAIWEAFLEAGGSRDRFVRTGGLSLGEYTALYVAGSMEFEDALRLVRRRGELMQEAALAVPSGMVSLIGASEESAAAVCDDARGTDVLVAANFNCPGQIVLSGSKAACERVVESAENHGVRAVPLAVAGAFHSPLMQPAADRLAEVLEATPMNRAAISVIANADAEYHGDPDRIRDALRRQLTEPVLWERCVRRMIDDGTGTFVEVGPGRVLTALLRKIDRDKNGISVNSQATLTAITADTTAR